MKRYLFALLVIILIAGALAYGYYYWVADAPNQTKVESATGDENEDMKLAEELLEEGKPQEAVEIIGQYADKIQNFAETQQQWLDLLIRASVATNNVQQLMILYNLYPSSFEDHEEASLLVAGEFLHRNRNTDYQELRNDWQGRETKEKEWFLLDSDSLLLEGKKTEAIDLLESEEFKGKEDVGRLIRLALAHLSDQPKVAWEYFTKAVQKDPSNAVVRLYRARLLEGYGQLPLAHLEYLAALQADPNNAAIRDQLAEFYLRYDQIGLALRMWIESLNMENPNPMMWVKALFWSKVALPVQFDFSSVSVKKSAIDPYIRYLLSLDSDQFWNMEAFRKLADQQTYLQNLQSTFWLRLLFALKEGDEDKAQTLLKYNVFKTESWAPELELALNRIVNYRSSGSLTLGRDSDLLVGLVQRENEREARLERESPPLFQKLEEAAQQELQDPTAVLDPKIETLLKSKEAYSAALIAGGWLEAGVKLHQLRVFSQDFPDWAAPAYTQALRTVRGNWEALEFASLQTETDEMAILIAELLIAAGNNDAALEKLVPLTDKTKETAEKASWLISLIYIDRKEYEKAKKAVTDNSSLADSLRGKETLARIALLEEQPEVAERIYRGILDESGEAKSFFAHQAFQEEDWGKARKLTEALIRQYPNNAVLHQNLRKIIEKQREQSEQK